MAFKDWKKTYDMKRALLVDFEWRTRKDPHSFIEITNHGLRMRGDRQVWEVNIFKGIQDKFLGKTSKVIVKRDFKTKAQALKFAKAYMRKH